MIEKAGKKSAKGKYLTGGTSPSSVQLLVVGKSVLEKCEQKQAACERAKQS